MVVGCDPGKAGAIVGVCTDHLDVLTLDMPCRGKADDVDTDAIEDTLLQWEANNQEHISLVVIEEQHAFPGQGAVSGWTFAMNYGALRDRIRSMQRRRVEQINAGVHINPIGLVEVGSQKWQKALGIVMPPAPKRPKVVDKKHLTEAEAAALKVHRGLLAQRKKGVKAEVKSKVRDWYPQVDVGKGDGRSDALALCRYGLLLGR